CFRSQSAAPKAEASVHEPLIDERLDHLAVIGARWARGLSHIDADNLFLGIDPEKGAGVTCPHELARRAWHTSYAVGLTHCKAKAERVARSSQQKLTRLERRRDARAELVGCHQLDGGAAQYALAVELAAVREHLAEPQIVHGGRNSASAAGIILGLR